MAVTKRWRLLRTLSKPVFKFNIIMIVKILDTCVGLRGGGGDAGGGGGGIEDEATNVCSVWCINWVFAEKVEYIFIANQAQRQSLEQVINVIRLLDHNHGGGFSYTK